MPKIINRVPPGFDSVFDWNEALRVAKQHLREEFKKERAANKKSEPERVYRLTELIKITGLQKSAIYEAIQQKQFPPPIKLTSRASGWMKSDIDAWLQYRKQVR